MEGLSLLRRGEGEVMDGTVPTACGVKVIGGVCIPNRPMSVPWLNQLGFGLGVMHHTPSCFDFLRSRNLGGA